MRRKQHGIRSTAACPVDQRFARRILAGPPGNQVDDAAEGAGAIERGRHALDHLDLSQVRGRNLQETETADIGADVLGAWSAADRTKLAQLLARLVHDLRGVAYRSDTKEAAG